MTFNTGNNVPSTDPRDLYDNAENLDKLVNGADPFYADRKGVLRESWAGMENSFNNAQEGRETAFTLSQADKEGRFQAFLVSSGYVSKGDYAANVVLEERNEYVAVDAATTGTSAGLYRPNASATLPLMLTGTWATDSANLVLLGDGVLRQQLAEENGSMLVFFRGAPLPKTLGRVLTPEQYGAVGDGAANDTAAWVAVCAAMQPGDTLRADGEYLIAGSGAVISGVHSFTVNLSGARFLQQTNNSRTLRIEGCTKFSVKGGEFYGRGGAAGEFIPASTSYNGVAGIYLSQCDYVQIYGNRLFDHAGGSIVWRESDHLFIHDNLVEGIGSTYISPGDNGQDFAIGGFSDNIARMDFVANISNNEIRGTAFGIFHNRCKSLIISGNTIDGIPGQHGIYTIECSGMAVTGNTFRNVNNQACKMQLENYAGRSFAPVGTLNHTGIVFSGNTVDDCGDGFAVISTSMSDGTDQKVFGVEVVGNTINNVTQDGLILNHCIDAQVGPNSINGTGRFGISFRNSSGSLFGNTIKESGASGISASQFDDIDYINNTLIDCGLNNLAGAGNDVPILVANTASPLPSQVATPKAFFRNNRIQFTSGDAASANLISTSTRNSVHIEGTRTNSLKTVRVDGPLLFCESNDFIGFSSGAQNSPSTFLPGHGRREYHGQQNPQAAGSTAAFQRGDICWNTNVLATGAVFWVCTASGSPGTWAVGATR